MGIIKMHEIGCGVDPNRIFLLSDGRIIRCVPNTDNPRWNGLNKIIFELFKYEIINEVVSIFKNHNVKCDSKIVGHLPIARFKGFSVYLVEPIVNVTRPSEWTNNQIDEIFLNLCEIHLWAKNLNSDNLAKRSRSELKMKFQKGFEKFINLFLGRNDELVDKLKLNELDEKLIGVDTKTSLNKCFEELNDSERIELSRYDLKTEAIEIFDDMLYRNEISERKISLTDCNIPNFTFQFNKPKFLDIGSFDRARGRVLYTHECLKNGIKTSEIDGYGEILNYINSYNSNPEYFDWELTIETINKINTKRNLDDCNMNNYWSHYKPRNIKSYEGELLSCKIRELGWDLGNIIDIGGNNGSLTNELSEHWKTRVLIDNCEEALEDSKNDILSSVTTTAKIDIINDDGGNNIPLHLESSWFTRLSGDTSFLSSIIHHIIKHGGDLKLIAKLCNMGKKYCIIEMISHTDPCVIGWYNEDVNIYNLLKILNHNAKWEIISTVENYEIKDDHKKTRKYYFLERK